MPLSAVSVLVYAQSSSEIPEGLTNNPVHLRYLAYKTPTPSPVSAPEKKKRVPKGYDKTHYP